VPYLFYNCCVVWLGSFGDPFKCQETSSIALLVWRLATWTSRQPDGTQTNDSGQSASRSLGGGVGPARRNEVKGLEGGWCLATQDGCARRWRTARCLAVTDSEVPGDRLESARRWWWSEDFVGAWRLAVCVARQAVLVQWWCARKGFYASLGDVHDVRLWLGARDECILYWGNTWPLRLYPGGLGSPVECASCGSYGEVSGDCPL